MKGMWVRSIMAGAILSSGVVACGEDATGPDADCSDDLDCPPPDLSGNWEITIPPLTRRGLTIAQVLRSHGKIPMGDRRA